YVSSLSGPVNAVAVIQLRLGSLLCTTWRTCLSRPWYCEIFPSLMLSREMTRNLGALVDCAHASVARNITAKAMEIAFFMEVLLLVVVNFWGLREARDWRFRGGIYTRAEPVSIPSLDQSCKGEIFWRDELLQSVRLCHSGVTKVLWRKLGWHLVMYRTH